MTRFERLCFGVGLIITEVILSLFFRHQQIGVGNYGMSFGMTGFLVVPGSIILILSLVLWKRLAIFNDWGWFLLLIGGVANLISRLISGDVWDYINVGGLLGVDILWNNGADIMIIMGVLVLVRGMISEYEKRNSNTI